MANQLHLIHAGEYPLDPMHFMWTAGLVQGTVEPMHHSTIGGSFLSDSGHTVQGHPYPNIFFFENVEDEELR